MSKEPDRGPDTGPTGGQPLNYVTPSTTRPPVSIRMVIGGFFTAAGAIVAALPMAPMYFGAPGGMLAAALVAGLIHLAFSAGRKPRWRSFAIGLWIGLGVSLLIEGICFAVLIRSLEGH